MGESNKKLQRLIETEDSAFLGFVESEGNYVPLQKNEDGYLTARLTRQSSTLIMNLEHIYEYFDKIYVFNPQFWLYSTVSSIGINIKKSNDIARFDISVRTLKVVSAGTISISIRQKEKRFYQKSSLNYEYIWIRAILLQK